ncbi:hypothetical protein ACQPXM_13810 [Kribbella sp. CA-253562]|uniref:hypothetical protein n=1 Tax=Kribbella sp. CA-253562 TaxID=3239942 RepID=UPI003D927687
MLATFRDQADGEGPVLSSLGTVELGGVPVPPDTADAPVGAREYGVQAVDRGRGEFAVAGPVVVAVLSHRGS